MFLGPRAIDGRPDLPGFSLVSLGIVESALPSSCLCSGSGLGEFPLAFAAPGAIGPIRDWIPGCQMSIFIYDCQDPLPLRAAGCSWAAYGTACTAFSLRPAHQHVLRATS